ncbi:unnamed protein product [Mytilus coruscus]|uniref:Reverse transcriptase domain-containing protein n=1 Tax=Mytilus coruscus TaxID=42192 RepID=A0A6J8CHG6_MYTCO|nr:unnamed protein product [Mytilus coruscus]
MSGSILKNVSIRFCEMDMNNFSRVQEAVFYSGKPNFAYCKIPVRSNFNIQLWEQLLEDYHDKIVFELLKHEEFIALLLNHGRGCAIWKLDLSRAFRQLVLHVLDPHDLHLKGYEWRGQIFIDNRLIFGMRSSPQACQRTTNAVSYMLWKSNIHTINYVDDFGGVSDNQNAELTIILGGFRIISEVRIRGQQRKVFAADKSFDISRQGV